MLKMILTIVLVVLILICAVIIIVKMRKKKRSIADTPAVVVSIRKIAEFVTLCFYEDKIMIERKPKKIVDNKLGNYIAEKFDKDDGLIYDEICLIANGQVRAGYDLNKITTHDIRIVDNVLEIKLPDPQIIDIIINPKGWDFYVEDGDWTEEEIKQIKSKAKSLVEQDAISYGVLQKVEQGKERLKVLLMSFGFKEVKFVQINDVK